MAGLKRVTDQNKWRQRCAKAAGLADVDVDFDIDPREDDAFEDDGCLHVRRHELHYARAGREIAAAIAGEKCPHGIYRHLINCALCDSPKDKQRRPIPHIRGSKQ